jgi:PAS domain S-box-containing protein
MSGPVAPHPPAAEAPQVVRPPSLGARVGVALLASAVAVALTIPLASVLARAIFLLGFAAVTLAAWYGGWRRRRARGRGVRAGARLLGDPAHRGSAATSPGDLAPMAGFVAVSLLIGRVHDALHAARDAAARRAAALVTANARLEAQAAELATTNHALQEQATELESQQAELEQATQVLHEQQAAIEEHAAALAERQRESRARPRDAVQARDALAGSEARARLAVEAAQLGIWMWDLTTDTAAFDARVRELFGFPDDAPPRPAILAERAHPEDQARIAALLAAAADPAGDGRYDATYRVVRPDGTTRWALATGQMTFAGAGEARRPVSLFGTVRDVTAQYTAEAAVRAAESRFRAVQDTSPDGSVLVESVRAPAAPRRPSRSDRRLRLHVREPGRRTPDRAHGGRDDRAARAGAVSAHPGRGAVRRLRAGRRDGGAVRHGAGVRARRHGSRAPHHGRAGGRRVPTSSSPT